MKKALQGSRNVNLCILSNNVCKMCRNCMPVLTLEDVKRICGFVALNCKSRNEKFEGCRAAGDLCLLASHAEEEEKFYELCQKAMASCPASTAKKAMSLRKHQRKAEEVGERTQVGLI